MSFLSQLLADLGPYDMNRTYSTEDVLKHWYNWWNGKPERFDITESEPDAFEGFKGEIMWDDDRYPDAWVIRWFNVDDIEVHYDANEENPDGVEKYVKKFKAGSTPPPIIIVKENGKLVTIDGAHRMASAKRAGEKKIRAFIPKDQV